MKRFKRLVLSGCAALVLSGVSTSYVGAATEAVRDCSPGGIVVGACKCSWETRSILGGRIKYKIIVCR